MNNQKDTTPALQLASKAWAVLGGETGKAKLFAGNATQAAKAATQLVEKVMVDAEKQVAKKAAEQAQAAATRAANSLKDIH
jgi:hypothetical protein